MISFQNGPKSRQFSTENTTDDKKKKYEKAMEINENSKPQ
jgi:hypothetical protein